MIVARACFRTSAPEALYGSARVDGAGHLRPFLVLAAPIVKGGMIGSLRERPHEGPAIGIRPMRQANKGVLTQEQRRFNAFRFCFL